MDGRLLIVEDEAPWRSDLPSRLGKAHPNWTIVTCPSVPEAAAVIERESPFDVVLTRLQMPVPGRSPDPRDHGGLTIVETARRKDPFTEIIVLTAHGDLRNVRKSLKRGANQYVWTTMQHAMEVLLGVTGNRMEAVVRLRALIDEAALGRICMASAAEKLVGPRAYLEALKAKRQEDREVASAYEAVASVIDSLVPFSVTTREPFPGQGDLAPEEAVRRGEEIYHHQLRGKVEAGNEGKMLVIDVKTGDYEIHDDDYTATERLRARQPDAEIYGFRIARTLDDATVGIATG